MQFKTEDLPVIGGALNKEGALVVAWEMAKGRTLEQVIAAHPMNNLWRGLD